MVRSQNKKRIWFHAMAINYNNIMHNNIYWSLFESTTYVSSDG